MKRVIKMSRYQISEEEYQAIRRAEKATKDKNVSRWLRILMMRYEGYKVREIAQITGMGASSISRLSSRQGNSFASLRSAPPGACRPTLTE